MSGRNLLIGLIALVVIIIGAVYLIEETEEGPLEEAAEDIDDAADELADDLEDTTDDRPNEPNS